MTRGEGIRTLLLANGTVNGMVGGNRIMPPPVKPKEVLWPGITYHEISGRETETHDGRSGLYLSRLQVNCWDKSYGGADDLREAVKAVLLHFTGLAGTLKVQGVNHAGDRYFYDGPNLLHQSICEFWIWWEA